MAVIRCPKCGKIHPVRKLSGQYRTASIIRVRIVEEHTSREESSDPEIVEAIFSVPVQLIAPPKKPAAPASRAEFLYRLFFQAFPKVFSKVAPFLAISLIWLALGVFLFLFPIPGDGSYAARVIAVFGTTDSTWGQPLLAAGMTFVFVGLTGAGIVRMITSGLPLLEKAIQQQPDPQSNARYQKSINRWKKLYYCRKCNHLFFPGSQNVMQMQPSLVEEIIANETEIENFLPRRSKVHFPTCPACHMRDAVEKPLQLSHTAVEAVGERAYSFAAEVFGKTAPPISRAYWFFSILILLVFAGQAIYWAYSVWAYHALYGGTGFIQYTLQRIQANPLTLGAYVSLGFFFLLSIFYGFGIIRRLAWLSMFYCGRCDLRFIPGVWSSPVE